MQPRVLRERKPQKEETKVSGLGLLAPQWTEELLVLKQLHDRAYVNQINDFRHIVALFAKRINTATAMEFNGILCVG